MLAPAHIQGTHPAAAQGTAAVFQPAVRYLGYPSPVLTQRKILLTKQTQPSHACDHRECCSLPQLCCLWRGDTRWDPRSRATTTKAWKEKYKWKTRAVNLKETTEIKKSSAWKSVSKEHRTSLHTGSTYCLNGSRRRCWTLWTRHVRDSSLTETVLDLLRLHHLPDTCPVSLALLPPWLYPPFGPSPSQLSLPYHCLLALWTSSPQALRFSMCGCSSPSPRGRCWQCRAPAGWMHKQTSYTTNTAMLLKEMTTGCYCITLLNNERVFLENTCHLIPLALQTRTTGW